VIASDGRAYVASQLQGRTAVVVLDVAARRELGAIPLDKTPRALDVSHDGKWLYFTLAGSNAVQVLDTGTRQRVAEIPVGASPHVPLFTPDGLTALVVSQGPGELGVLDPASRSVIGTIKVGEAPHWVATTGDGRMAYVTNEVSGDLSIVDLAHRHVVTTIAVGNGPRKVAVQPGPGSQTVGSAASGTAANATPAVGQSLRFGALTFAYHGTETVTGRAEHDLEADDYYFSPTFLRGEPGQRLKLEVENESTTLHNLTIPSLGIDRDLPPKGKLVVDVTFPPSGVLRFYCKLHEALGMNGELLAGAAMPAAAP
jgi:YVTN family beta-propeller protein